MKYFALYVHLTEDVLKPEERHILGNPISVVGRDPTLPDMTLEDFVKATQSLPLAVVARAEGYHIAEVKLTIVNQQPAVEGVGHAQQ
jgi:hypothetical protein